MFLQAWHLRCSYWRQLRSAAIQAADTRPAPGTGGVSASRLAFRPTPDPSFRAPQEPHRVSAIRPAVSRDAGVPHQRQGSNAEAGSTALAAQCVTGWSVRLYQDEQSTDDDAPILLAVMKTPPKRAAAARKSADQPLKDDRMVILVRRGALRRFDALTQKTTELPVVVSWDRRQTERRRTGATDTVERRRADRRQTTPFTWELADFVVLPGGSLEDNAPSAAAAEPRAKSSTEPRPPSRARKPLRKAVGRKTARGKKQAPRR